MKQTWRRRRGAAHYMEKESRQIKQKRKLYIFIFYLFSLFFVDEKKNFFFRYFNFNRLIHGKASQPTTTAHNGLLFLKKKNQQQLLQQKHFI
jgi:hypothetical protein